MYKKKQTKCGTQALITQEWALSWSTTVDIHVIYTQKTLQGYAINYVTCGIYLSSVTASLT